VLRLSRNCDFGTPLSIRTVLLGLMQMELQFVSTSNALNVLNLSVGFGLAPDICILFVAYRLMENIY
jgi:hypothetical protein